ncbi:MAG: hypothetical protein Q7U48_13875 [Hydrogenophaga sp.]|nr:hypothetical protein [Hydrogenophaga sp.]
MSIAAATARVVAAYAHSDQSRQVVKMLDALISEYRDELEASTGDRTLQLQMAARQCRALKSVLSGVAHADPRV